MAYIRISDEALAIMRVLAGEHGERCLHESLLPMLHLAMDTETASIADVRDGLSDPYYCLEALFSHYAFARRGKERAELAELAVEALRRVTSVEAVEDFLSERDASSLWTTFEEVCAERRRKPLEQLNRGVIAGLAELAQEIYRADGTGSIASWAVKAILQTDRLEPEFMRMVDVRGVGPKLTSLFLRDVVLIFSLEERLDHVDRLYIQPIDKWIRLIAPYVIQEDGIEDAADWILAGKLSKYTRHSGVSGVMFNMGATHFGMREARIAENLEAALERALAKEYEGVQRRSPAHRA